MSLHPRAAAAAERPVVGTIAPPRAGPFVIDFKSISDLYILDTYPEGGQNDIQADTLIPNPQPSTEPGQTYDNPVLYLSSLWRIRLHQQGGHVPLHFLG
jgi:hypothetical protein